MKKEGESQPFTIIHQIIGVFFILLSILFFFTLLEWLVETPDVYRYRTPIIYEVITIIAGIALFKNKKIGWIVLVPAAAKFILSAIYYLQIPNYPEMVVDFDYRRIKILILSILFAAVLAIVLLPKFWRPFRLKWFHVLIVIILFILLVWGDNLLMYQLGFRSRIA